MKERLWRYEQKLIIDLRQDVMSWELRELLVAYGTKNYGTVHAPRKA